jgi:hypothetical protein
LAHLAELASQIWTRRSWFQKRGLEIGSYSIDTLTLNQSAFGSNEYKSTLVINASSSLPILSTDSSNKSKYHLNYRFVTDNATDMEIVESNSDVSQKKVCDDISHHLETLLAESHDAGVLSKVLFSLHNSI